MTFATRTDTNDSPSKNKRRSQNNAFLAVISVLKNILNTKPEPSQTMDAAIFRVSDWNRWIVNTIPSRNSRLSRIGTHRIEILQNTTPIWNILVKDLDPTKYWNTALVKQLETLQQKMPSTPCVVLTTSMRFYRYEQTMRRLKRLGIQFCPLEHRPSDPQSFDELTRVLSERLTLETIDPHGTLGKESLDEWLQSKDTGRSN